MTLIRRLPLAGALLLVVTSVGFSGGPLTAQDTVTRVQRLHVDLTWRPGNRRESAQIETVADWEIRRADILKQMQVVMGPLPKPASPVVLDVKVLAEQPVSETLVRRKISYHTDSTERRVNAWLFIPKVASKANRHAAVLCLHQTTGIGKDEPAGLGGNPNLHYALHLAARGFVTLAPDYPSFGEYPYEFPASDGYISGSMKAIYDNTRAIDLLQSLDEVDPERIGCIGHSLGGHNTMFTAAFDRRIKVMVSNCGFTRFHKYYGGRLKGWMSPRYMPLINERFENNPDRVPFDFPEIVASFAPRPFLASSPIGDSNFEVSGVRDSIAAAKPIYALYGAGQNLDANYPDCAHDFPDAVRERAYRFLETHLVESARGR